MGLTRLELVTSCLSGTRSNHLSYSPDRYIREEKKNLRLFRTTSFFIVRLHCELMSLNLSS